MHFGEHAERHAGTHAFATATRASATANVSAAHVPQAIARRAYWPQHIWSNLRAMQDLRPASLCLSGLMGGEQVMSITAWPSESPHHARACTLLPNKQT
eukprot:11912043-Alexandrium_andersonii.AAC.1